MINSICIFFFRPQYYQYF